MQKLYKTSDLRKFTEQKVLENFIKQAHEEIQKHKQKDKNNPHAKGEKTPDTMQ